MEYLTIVCYDCIMDVPKSFAARYLNSKLELYVRRWLSTEAPRPEGNLETKLKKMTVC